MEEHEQQQGNRTVKIATVVAVYMAALLLSSFALAADKKGSSTSEAASAPAGDSDKVDLKKLEEKYWAAKDSDYSVIQNRAYPKDKRFFFTLGYGPLMNDLYSIGRMTGLSLGYYFSERMGVEIVHEIGNLSDNDGVIKYRQTYGVQADYNRFLQSTNVMFILVPFYAKMSFFDRSILYFDMQFAVGVGQSKYDVVRAIGTQQNSSTDFEFDVTQQVFFHRNFAIRFDIKNKFYDQVRKNYNSGADLGGTKAHDTTILLGLTTFLP